jgi:expansin
VLHNAKPAAWWLRKRTWVIATAATVVAGATTMALVAQASGAACAAAAAISGQATFYAADGGGNCSFDPVENPMVVALGNAEYRAAAACGGYLDVKGPKGTVRVKVTDRCPECAAGHIDLGRQAFAKIADTNAGIVNITYSHVTNPPVPGPMTVRVKEGSSRYWLALRLDNTGNPLSSVELQAGVGWKALSHTDYNYWIAQNGAAHRRADPVQRGPRTARVDRAKCHGTGRQPDKRRAECPAGPIAVQVRLRARGRCVPLRLLRC